VSFRWLKRRQDASDRVSADAKALIEQFGDGAYGEARKRARDALARQSRDPHRAKVRCEIGRRTGRVYIDTATRYLDPKLQGWAKRSGPTIDATQGRISEERNPPFHCYDMAGYGFA
jgi:hypothetical protein